MHASRTQIALSVVLLAASACQATHDKQAVRQLVELQPSTRAKLQAEGALHKSLCTVQACSLHAFAAHLPPHHSSSQLLALQILFGSLQRTQPAADFLALVPEGVADGVVRKLSAQQIRTVRLQQQTEAHRLHAIVAAFGLTEYASILLLDAHHLVLRPMEDLLACGSFCVRLDATGQLDTSLMVLKPAAKAQQELQAQIPAALADCTADGCRSPEAVLLSGYFASTSSSPICRLAASGVAQTGACWLPLDLFQDTSAYYMRGRWAASNSRGIRFSAPAWLEPWHWWSWPLLHLSLEWHRQRATVLAQPQQWRSAMSLAVAGAVMGILATYSMQWVRQHRLSKALPVTAHQAQRAWLARAAQAAVFTVSVMLPAWVIPTSMSPVLAWPLYFELLGVSWCAVHAAGAGPAGLWQLWSTLVATVALLAALPLQTYLPKLILCLAFAFCLGVQCRTLLGFPASVSDGVLDDHRQAGGSQSNTGSRRSGVMASMAKYTSKQSV